MTLLFQRVKYFFLLGILLVGCIGCGVSGNDTGRLILSLTDKPASYDQVWITIDEIYAHKEGDPEDSWTKILTVDRTINLMTLAGGVREELGMVDLAPGHYTQMRLMIGTTNRVDLSKPANYVADKNGNVIEELTIPSGVQSGVKLVQGFDINESSTTRLIFDFQVATSIIVTGNGKYILRPTIHQIDDSETRTIIKGLVKDKAGAAVPGASVSLQVYTPRADGQDYKNEIGSPYWTVTDSTGAYLFWFLDIPTATTFNVVATKWNSTDPKYGFDWAQVPGAINGNAYIVDDLPAGAPLGPLTLPEPAEFGKLDLRAIINDTDAVKVEDKKLFVTISIRKLSDLPGTPTPWVEVMKQDIVGYDDEWALTDIKAVSIELPYGDYEVVASIDGRKSLLEVKTISATAIAIDFIFPNP